MIPGADTAGAQAGMPAPDMAAAGPGMIPVAGAQDPNMGVVQDPNMMGGMSGMDPSMMGNVYAPPIKSAKELGRIYELNKIYTRLYTIHKILSNTSDSKLQTLREMTSEAFEIFRLILNNIRSYVNIIDDIILKYYEFLGELVKLLDIYFKANSEKDNNVKSTD
jgi:hypothetical protein